MEDPKHSAQKTTTRSDTRVSVHRFNQFYVTISDSSLIPGQINYARENVVKHVKGVTVNLGDFWQLGQSGSVISEKSSKSSKWVVAKSRKSSKTREACLAITVGAKTRNFNNNNDRVSVII